MMAPSFQLQKLRILHGHSSTIATSSTGPKGVGCAAVISAAGEPARTISEVTSQTFGFETVSNVHILILVSLEQAQKVLDVQRRLAQQVNHAKRERMLDEISEELVERIREVAGAKISAIMEDPSYGKVGTSRLSL